MSNVREVLPEKNTVNLDGKDYVLEFNMNTFAELELKYGSMEKALEAVDSGSMLALRKLLYEGLKYNDETLTEEKLGRMITLDKIPVISEAITKVMMNAMPKKDANAPGVVNPN